MNWGLFSAMMVNAICCFYAGMAWMNYLNKKGE